jgi:hypothetical protein
LDPASIISTHRFLTRRSLGSKAKKMDPAQAARSLRAMSFRMLHRHPPARTAGFISSTVLIIFAATNW